MKNDILCFLCSTAVCLFVVFSTAYVEKRKNKQQSFNQLISKITAYIMCAVFITIGCGHAYSAAPHISSIIYISLVFVCQGLAGLLKKIFCPDSQWTNFRCHIEGFIIAISVVFAFFEFWNVSIVLWVYVIAFYFNFDFEDFKGLFSTFLRSLPRIILSCLVWLSVFGLSYFLDGIIQEHSVAVKVPWFLTIGVGIVWLIMMKIRKKRTC